MITFKQFLTESSTIEDDYQTIADLLKQKCSKYINSSDLEIEAWNGISKPRAKGEQIGDNGLAYVAKVRKNRRPRNSSPKFHDFLDNFLKEKFGLAGRSESLFATRLKSVARGYAGGDSQGVYRIFPIGNYQTLWSPVIDDAFNVERFEYDSEFEDMLIAAVMKKYNTTSKIDAEYYISDAKRDLQEDPTDTRWYEILEVLFEMFSDKLYVKNDLHKMKTDKNFNEIMFLCDEYIAIKADNVDKILKLL